MANNLKKTIFTNVQIKPCIDNDNHMWIYASDGKICGRCGMKIVVTDG